jgi:hypothetical protein
MGSYSVAFFEQKLQGQTEFDPVISSLDRGLGTTQIRQGKSPPHQVALTALATKVRILQDWRQDRARSPYYTLRARSRRMVFFGR